MTDAKVLAHRIIDLVGQETSDFRLAATALALALGSGIGSQSPDRKALDYNCQLIIPSVRKFALESFAERHKP